MKLWPDGRESRALERLPARRTLTAASSPRRPFSDGGSRAELENGTFGIARSGRGGASWHAAPALFACLALGIMAQTTVAQDAPTRSVWVAPTYDFLATDAF